MKKLFTSMAVAALALTANAADFNFTVDPAEGDVEMLQFVTLTFPNLEEIEINSADDITITRNGTVVPGVDKSVEESNKLSLVLGAEQTDPATYLVNIPAGALCGYADSYEWIQDSPEDIVLTYEIKAGATAGFDWGYLSYPEEGEVDEIRDIMVMFPNIAEIEINSKDDIVLKHDGTPVEATVSLIDETTFGVEPADALTEAGTYTLEVAAGAIGAYNADYTEFEDNQAIVLTWTIAGSQTGGDVDFSYTSSLPTDGYLAYFGEVTLTFPNVETLEYAGEGVSVKKDGEAIADVTVKAEANKLTATLKEALNFTDGTVTLEVAPEALTATTADGATAKNAEAISVSYKMASPVEYNLTLAISTPKPNADGEISADKSLSSMFFTCEEKGLLAAEGTEANVTIKEVDGDFKATAHLKKANGLNQNFTYFSADFGKEPTYNGRYTVTIEKNAFGTEAWSVDPNYGRSNDRLELSFTLVDGIDRTSYTLEPESITPQAGTYAKGTDIATVTLTFADGVEAKSGAGATLAGVDNSYAQQALFTVADGKFTVTFDPAPTEDGKYVLSVEQGAFVGAEASSAPITVEYEVSVLSGVSSIEADEVKSILNLQGISLGTDVKSLPAGLYIINGKKVLVK